MNINKIITYFYLSYTKNILQNNFEIKKKIKIPIQKHNLINIHCI